MTSVESARERLFANLQGMMKDVEDLIKATASQASNGTAAFRDRAKQTMDSAKSTLAENKALLNSSKRRAVAYAQENPWHTAAITAGVAMAIACLLLSKRTK